MVAKGIGISFLPAWAIAEELRKGRMRGIFVAGHNLRRSLAVCHLKSNPAAAVRAFLTFLRQHQEEIQNAARPDMQQYFRF